MSGEWEEAGRQAFFPARDFQSHVNPYVWPLRCLLREHTQSQIMIFLGLCLCYVAFSLISTSRNGRDGGPKVHFSTIGTERSVMVS